MDEDYNKEEEMKDEDDEVQEKLPAPLVAAPGSQLIPAVNQNLPVGLSSATSNGGSGAAHPYFYFVFLDWLSHAARRAEVESDTNLRL